MKEEKSSQIWYHMSQIVAIMKTPLNGFPKKTYLSLAGIMVAVSMLIVIVSIINIGLTFVFLDICVQRYDHSVFDNYYRMRYVPSYYDEKNEWQNGNADDWGDEVYSGSDGVRKYDESEKSTTRLRRPCWELQKRPLIYVPINGCSEGMIANDEPTLALYVAGVSFYIFYGIFAMAIGSIGIRAAQTNISHRKSGLKYAFQVLCIVNTATFGLAMLGASICDIVFLDEDDRYLGRDFRYCYRIFMIVAISCILLLSLVSSFVACCCSPVEEVNAKSLDVKADVKETENPPTQITPKTEMEEEKKEGDKVFLIDVDKDDSKNGVNWI